MPTDARDLLEVLKSELEFVQGGGYGNLPHARWRPHFMFEDSPTCPNSLIQESRVPCTECVLIELVPPERRSEKIPCRHIPLKETGETLDYYYRCGTRDELEEAFVGWLRKTIHQLEEDRRRKDGGTQGGLQGNAQSGLETKSTIQRTGITRKRWEHFAHQADIGIRGAGATREEAFEQGAVALTAVITDVNSLEPINMVQVACEAPNDELLFVDWLNAIVYEMATRKMLFCRFEVHIEGERLRGNLWGQPIDVAKHEPATEIKGATYTELQVKRERDGTWIAQCIVDV